VVIVVSMNTLQIDARPAPFELDPSHAAVIVVDMENDFGAAGGMFESHGIDVSGIQAAVAPTARVLDAARQAGVPIVYLKMAFKPDLSDLGPTDAANGQRHAFFGVGDGKTLIRDTWGTDIVEELTPEPDDHVVYKHRFSGFFETELEDLLRGLGVRDLIFTGCTTSVCVDATLRDAMYRDFRCLLIEDCVAEPIGSDTDRPNHEATVLQVQLLFGWVSRSSALVDALAGGQAASLT
jgi:ureidoacrylate peracid hydrolase